MPRNSRLLPVLAALAIACSSPTELVVVVDSDLAVPAELDAVRVRITGPSGRAMDATQSLGGTADPPLPLTLGVTSAAGSLGPIDVDVEGLLDGAAVVERTARTSLLAGQSLT